MDFPPICWAKSKAGRTSSSNFRRFASASWSSWDHWRCLSVGTFPAGFFLKINDELPTIFSKKVPISLYHTSMIIVWYFYDSFGRGRLVNPLDDSNDTQISYKFLMWPQRSTPDPFLSIQHWTSLKELSSSPSMFSDLANTCGLKEDIPNPPSSPGFSPWALPQALALDDWVMKQGSTT